MISICKNTDTDILDYIYVYICMYVCIYIIIHILLRHGEFIFHAPYFNSDLLHRHRIQGIYE